MYRDLCRNPKIVRQMELACEALKEWSFAKPAIAGGALWSWAANCPARDVDLFVKNSWRARRKVKSLVRDDDAICLTKKVKREYHYGSYSTKVKTVRLVAYRSVLPDGTPMDIVLVPCQGLDIPDHFDYYHCAVAFGIKGAVLKGVNYYVEGKLEQQFPEGKGARSEEVIKKKIQLILWGSPAAETRMVLTIGELRSIYLK